MALGEAFYGQCAACHGASGGGTLPVWRRPWRVLPGSPGRRSGWRVLSCRASNGPLEVNGENWDGIMPPHGHLPELDDATLAGLMTYLRRSWGNQS